MSVCVVISTGGDTWAVLQFQNKKIAIEKVAEKYAYAKVKYNGERTTIKGLNEDDIAIVKEKARSIIKSWNGIKTTEGETAII
jgi:hypothetical protein